MYYYAQDLCECIYHSVHERSEDSFAWASSGEHRLPGMHDKHLYTHQAISLAQLDLFFFKVIYLIMHIWCEGIIP